MLLAIIFFKEDGITNQTLGKRLCRVSRDSTSDRPMTEFDLSGEGEPIIGK
jgi:hypothetical protein